MARYTFGKKAGRIEHRATATKPRGDAEGTVRELIRAREKLPGEDYRERSLALHGLICARCAREFEPRNRHLLTVHHRDGNHTNNPSDGSNWENLCVDCHEDVHSRRELARHLGTGAANRDRGTLVHRDEPVRPAQGGGPTLGTLLQQALKKRDGNS